MLKSLLNPIKNILVNNRLVKGRLKISMADIQGIFRSKEKLHNKLLNELDKEQKKMKDSLLKMKNIKLELRDIQETLQKAFQPSNSNISLLYKIVGKNKYVKARFYWYGKQREVQIGSFEVIMSTIYKMIKAGYLKNISFHNSNKMTWKKFNQNNELVMAAKEIAALKCQEYVLRKILNEDKENEVTKNINEQIEVSSSPEYEKALNINDEKYDWYDKWREENM